MALRSSSEQCLYRSRSLRKLGRGGDGVSRGARAETGAPALAHRKQTYGRAGLCRPRQLPSPRREGSEGGRGGARGADREQVDVAGPPLPAACQDSWSGARRWCQADAAWLLLWVREVAMARLAPILGCLRLGAKCSASAPNGSEACWQGAQGVDRIACLNATPLAGAAEPIIVQPRGTSTARRAAQA